MEDECYECGSKSVEIKNNEMKCCNCDACFVSGGYDE